MKLETELIPKGAWGQSVCKKFPREWEIIRHQIYKNANSACQICGAKDKRLEGNEEYQYEKLGVGKLVSFICVCYDCHRVIHFENTLTQIKEGKISDITEKLILHYNKVNDIIAETDEVFYQERINALKLWKKRSFAGNKIIQWKIDLSYMNDYMKLMNGV